MNDIFTESVFMGIALTLGAYWIGMELRKRFNYVLVNPLLIATGIVCLFLVVGKIDYNNYNLGAKYITFFLTPVTVSLAIPMYRQLKQLQKHFFAIILSVFSGAVACAAVIFGLSILLHVKSDVYYSLLPKSVTTAIALPISSENGGIESITVMALMISGLLGGVFVSSICKIARIIEPEAIGLACGSASHVVGTSRAMEIGELEGAMSSLAIVVTGIMTVFIVPFMSGLL